MKIVDYFGIPVKACLYTEYRGLTITISTLVDGSSILSNSEPVVVVWENDGDESTQFPAHHADTLDEMIAYIDNLMGAR